MENENGKHGQIMKELGEISGTMKGMQSAMQIANGRTSKIEGKVEHIDGEIDTLKIKVTGLDKDSEFIRDKFGAAMVEMQDFIKERRIKEEEIENEKLDRWSAFAMEILKGVVMLLLGALGSLLVYLVVNHKF